MAVVHHLIINKYLENSLFISVVLALVYRSFAQHGKGAVGLGRLALPSLVELEIRHLLSLGTFLSQWLFGGIKFIRGNITNIHPIFMLSCRG